MFTVHNVHIINHTFKCPFARALPMIQLVEHCKAHISTYELAHLYAKHRQKSQNNLMGNINCKTINSNVPTVIKYSTENVIKL